MWRVKSEAGQLHAVLVQESIESFWERKFPFAGIESNSLYLARCPHADIDGGMSQWRQLPKYLKGEGVHVFEVTEILGKILENASLPERKEIVDYVWDGLSDRPEPHELLLDHLIYGYPSKPYYDQETDQVVLPDFQRLGWPYPRDTSFTTQVGTVICNMRRYSRLYEPMVVNLCYRYDPVLSEKVEVVYDANDTKGGFTEPPCVEGGDTQIIDEETIAIGIGQRSTFTGFKEAARQLFESDTENILRHIVAVKLADYPATDYMHLDVVINYPNAGKALAMPYFWDSKYMKDTPRSLLMKSLDALRMQSEKAGRHLGPMVHPKHFEDSGSCWVYGRGESEPKLISSHDCFVDYLVEEDKLEADELVYVGGRPDKKNDVEHLMLALMELSRGATNVFALKPDDVIAYERNHVTNNELREHGVTVKEWEDSYLDMLGGPHCSTSPLMRDAL